MQKPDRVHDGRTLGDGGEPRPPGSLPKYVVEAVTPRTVPELRALAAWAEDLAACREQRPIEVDEAEELVEVDEDNDEGAGAQVIKKVPCGKDCNGCPHGPYEYRVQRQGETLNWEYIGPVDS